MLDLLSMMLAARNRTPNFEWVIPVIFFAVYAFSAIGKVLKERKDKQQQEESPKPKPRYKSLDDEQERLPVTGQQRRAQRLPYAPKQPQRTRPVTPRTVEPAAFEELSVSAPQPVRPAAAHPTVRSVSASTPKRIPTATHKRTHAVRARTTTAVKRQAAPATEKSITPKPQPKPATQKSRLAELLTDNNDLRRGIIYSEIFGKPIGLRDQL